MSHPTHASGGVDAGPRLEGPESGVEGLFRLPKNAMNLNCLLLDGSVCACFYVSTCSRVVRKLQVLFKAPSHRSRFLEVVLLSDTLFSLTTFLPLHFVAIGPVFRTQQPSLFSNGE